MKRTIHFAVYLYPAWWRARYGPELDALVDDMSPGFGDLLNIAKGALLMQFSRLDLPLSVATCGLLGTCVAALVFFATPRRYASTSTIEIQAEDHATGPKPTTVASLMAFSDRKIASLIESIGLYPGEQRSRPVAELILRFREDVSVKLTTPVARARSEQSWDGVLLRDQGALQVAFTYPDRRKAQEVAAALGRLVIDEAVHSSAEEARVHHYVFRVAGPPQQVPAGPNLTAVMSLGLCAGVLAGVGIATLRRRIQRSH